MESLIMTLTFDIHVASLIIWFSVATNFEITGCNSFRKINNFHFFHTNAKVTKLDLGVKYLKVKLGRSQFE